MAFNQLDELDQQLIALLRVDGRASVSTLATTLHVSRGTVQNRIDRMLDSGAILGFTIRTRQDVEPGAVRALTSLRIVGTSATTMTKKLRGMPEIRALHTTNGSWDMVVEIQVGTLQELDSALRAIRAVSGVHDTETSILLTTT